MIPISSFFIQRTYLFKKKKKSKFLIRKWTDLEMLQIWIVINFVTV